MKINPTEAGFYHAGLSETRRLGYARFKDVAISHQSQKLKLWRISAACPDMRLSNQRYHLGELKLACCHSSIWFSGNLNFHQWKWGWQHHKTGFELCWISRTKETFWWHFYLWLPSKCKCKPCSMYLRRRVGSFRHVFTAGLAQALAQELLQNFSLAPLRTPSRLAVAPSWDKLPQQDALPRAFLLLSLSSLPPILGRFGLHYSAANNYLIPSPASILHPGEQSKFPGISPAELHRACTAAWRQRVRRNNHLILDLYLQNWSEQHPRWRCFYLETGLAWEGGQGVVSGAQVSWPCEHCLFARIISRYNVMYQSHWLYSKTAKMYKCTGTNIHKWVLWFAAVRAVPVTERTKLNYQSGMNHNLKKNKKSKLPKCVHILSL